MQTLISNEINNLLKGYSINELYLCGKFIRKQPNYDGCSVWNYIHLRSVELQTTYAKALADLMASAIDPYTNLNFKEQK